MSHPKRADHFKKWSQMMLEQAIVPERLEYKGAPSVKSPQGRKTSRRGRRKRFRSRKRQQQE